MPGIIIFVAGMILAVLIAKVLTYRRIGKLMQIDAGTAEEAVIASVCFGGWRGALKRYARLIANPGMVKYSPEATLTLNTALRRAALFNDADAADAVLTLAVKLEKAGGDHRSFILSDEAMMTAAEVGSHRFLTVMLKHSDEDCLRYYRKRGGLLAKAIAEATRRGHTKAVMVMNQALYIEGKVNNQPQPPPPKQPPQPQPPQPQQPQPDPDPVTPLPDPSAIGAQYPDGWTEPPKA